MTPNTQDGQRAEESKLCRCIDCGSTKPESQMYRLTSGEYICPGDCLSIYLDTNDLPAQAYALAV